METVQTEAGAIAGTLSKSSGVAVFKGIPYAAPPVAKLRWRAPQAATPWEGVLLADRVGPRCMQGTGLGDIDPDNPRMSEDCLYLNVWTPARAGQRLPVMVWIHGGGFQSGSGSEPWYDGENLARKGVLVVTLNYRLGAFGFLAHPELSAQSGENSSGEYGLLDQIAALQWVQRNIAGFGGDPDRVTVFGESAGAAAIGVLVASPSAQGSFHRAIAQSGAVTVKSGSPYAMSTLQQAEQVGLKFAKAAGAETIEALRAKSAKEILELTLSQFRLEFAPISGGKLLPEGPIDMYAKRRHTDIPLLAGWNTDEGTLFGLGSSVGGMARLDPELFKEEARKRFGTHSRRLLKLYPAGSEEQAKASSDALLGDELVAYPMWKWMQLHARGGAANVYRYRFDLRPPAPQMSVNPLAAPGVFHSAEIVYAFDNLHVRSWPWREEDRHLARVMSQYWVNFAATGDPNGGELPTWPSYVPKKSGKVMRLDAKPQAETEVHRDRFELLDRLYDVSSN